MVHFVGAGPGAPDLITVRGARLIGEADVIIYAGSLVNPALLEMKKESCAQMFTNGQGICMGDGEIWFLDVNFDGVEQTADPLLKIIAVQGIKE